MNFSRPVTCIASFKAVSTASVPLFAKWVRVGDLTRAYFESGDGPSEMELRTLRKDGSVRWVVLRADVDREHARPRRILGIAMDVTAHHAALDALREASQRAAFITEQVAVAIRRCIDAAGHGRQHQDNRHTARDRGYELLEVICADRCT